MADTLQFQQKEEKGVILDQALLADDTVKRVLRGILQADILSNICEGEEEVGVDVELARAT